tara:strand:+ start:1194 stop:1982 length:789 start_codon:yes stop_codon:yes gene_type:complete
MYRKTAKEDLNIYTDEDLPDPLSNLIHVMREDSKRIIPLISSLLKNEASSFIDIGSGYGQLSFDLAKSNSNLDIHLLETSRERLELGIKGFKVNRDEFTFHHRLLDKNFASEYTQSFEICLCFHVLEHVYDIKDFIRNLFLITKNGGTIIIEVPNEDDDLLRLSSGYSKIVRFPAHVNSFNQKTLSLLLKTLNEDSYKVEFVPVQRYGFYNYIEWLRYNEKAKISSDDYIPRDEKSWIESIWLEKKSKGMTTDSIMLIIKKL